MSAFRLRAGWQTVAFRYSVGSSNMIEPACQTSRREALLSGASIDVRPAPLPGRPGAQRTAEGARPDRILARINEHPSDWKFSTQDFVDLREGAVLRHILAGLVQKGRIQRLKPGFYARAGAPGSTPTLSGIL